MFTKSRGLGVAHNLDSSEDASTGLLRGLTLGRGGRVV